MALPITARSTRCCASAPIEAPTSSTTDSPLRVGHRPAIAGRSMPAMVLRSNLRHRHQRAGIAGRDRDVGFALLDRIDGEPHRRLPAAMPQRLARLVVHAGRRRRCATSARFGLEPRQLVEQRLDHGAVAEQQELDVGVAGRATPRRRGTTTEGAMVAAHGVKRDADLIRHGATLTALDAGTGKLVPRG